jgi:hypothetical protein
MRALALGFAFALLSWFGASAEPEMQCGPGEASIDLSPRMPPGVTAVWVLSVVTNGRGVDFYQLGYSEKKKRWSVEFQVAFFCKDDLGCCASVAPCRELQLITSSMAGDWALRPVHRQSFFEAIAHSIQGFNHIKLAVRRPEPLA